MEWSKADTLRLIADYESLEALWNIHSVQYKNKDIRNDALRLLAHTYACTVGDISKKVYNLRSQFHREHEKVLRSRKALAGKSELPYRSKWFGYEPLLFLLNGSTHGRKRNSQNKELYSSSEENDETSGPAQSNASLFPVQDPVRVVPEEMSQNVGEECSQHFTSDLKSNFTFPQKITVKSPSELMPEKTDFRDEYTIFGEHIATQLRNLNDRRSFYIAQHMINSVLFQAQMGILKDSPLPPPVFHNPPVDILPHSSSPPPSPRSIIKLEDEYITLESHDHTYECDRN
ncbi:uncharacterized protein [Anabrus simplex]|uniref:uncharacterized protein n=1 Tax=Anabrus simplex TaxID=316456 RepID=UPI0035A2BAC6